MSEHYPSPWEFDPDDRNISHRGAIIASVYGQEDFPCLEDEERDAAQAELDANAYLIAAAPELLEALQSTSNALGHWINMACIDCGQGHEVGDHPRAILNQAQVAIAKARGQEAPNAS